MEATRVQATQVEAARVEATQVEATHLEVTYGGVLAAVDGGAERPLTSEEFSAVFERMADKLHDIGGLVDPGLWGQASNGTIEMEFYLLAADDVEAMAARAMAVVSEVGAAGGVDIAGCAHAAGSASELAADRSRGVVNHAQEQPRFVLNAGRHTAELVTA